MKRNLFLFLSTCAFSLGANARADVATPAQGAQPANKAPAQEVGDSKGVAAVVSGETISRDQVLSQLKMLTSEAEKNNKPLSEKDKERYYNAILGQMLSQLVFKKAAVASGVSETPEYKQLVKDQAEALLVKYFVQSEQQRILKEAGSSAKDSMKQMGDQYQIFFKQMTVPSDKGARIINALGSDKKKNFADLARQFDINKGTEGLGETKAVPEIMLPDELKAKFISQKPGSVFSIPSKNGVVIFQFVGRSRIEDPKILEEIAMRQIMKDLGSRWVKDLYKKADIKVFNMKGDPSSLKELESLLQNRQESSDN
jgi:hypothetical protein